MKKLTNITFTYIVDGNREISAEEFEEEFTNALENKELASQMLDDMKSGLLRNVSTEYGKYNFWEIHKNEEQDDIKYYINHVKVNKLVFILKVARSENCEVKALKHLKDLLKDDSACFFRSMTINGDIYSIERD